MSKKMLVESDPHETRIAIMEQDRLTELFIERRQQLGVVGNIYKGRVNRVLPGMQAAFVDIGLDRDAFLYVSEVADPHLPFDEASDDDTDNDGSSEDEDHSLSHTEAPRPSIDQLLRPGQFARGVADYERYVARLKREAEAKSTEGPKPSQD